MRTIEETNQFKRDFRRVLKGQYRKTAEVDFFQILELLVNDEPMPLKYRDHALTGDYRDCRDCHIAPDLVLIYQKPDLETLILIRFGSHSELGF